MTYTADPRVDAYIDALPDWQQAICREVRDLIHAADPEVSETIKRRNRPYFILAGNVCALLAAKDHVNIFLYEGAIVPDPIASSLLVTTTKPLVRWPSGGMSRSTQLPSPPCCGTSLPTIAPVAGAS